MKKKITIILAVFAIALPLSINAHGNVAQVAKADDSVLEKDNVKFEGEDINEEGELEATFEVKKKEDDALGGLLEVARKNGRFGDEIKRIVEEQKEALEETTKAKKSVESRGKLKTFLIGSDYKNIGAIRSEMVKTEARIEQLRREAEKLIPLERAEVEAEITKLEESEHELEHFIEENESKFSLFGWLAKLF